MRTHLSLAAIFITCLLCVSAPSARADDCNNNGIPDVDELVGNDCNQNGVPDDCDPVDPASCPDYPRPMGCGIGHWRASDSWWMSGVDLDPLSDHIATSDNRLAIGEYWDDTNGNNVGTVKVYRQDATGWVLEDQLFPPENEPNSRFGFVVRMQRDILIVSAMTNDFSGRIHVFRHHGNHWAYESTVALPTWAEAPISLGYWGRSIAIDGDRLVVSVGNTNSDHLYSGVVILRYVSGQFRFETYFYFPQSRAPTKVAIEGNVIATRFTSSNTRVVRILERDANGWRETPPISTPGVTTSQDDIAMRDGRIAIAGESVYVYERVNDEWMLTGQADSPTPGDIGFAAQIEMDGERIAVSATDVDTGLPGSGAVYLYEWDNNAWVLSETLTPTPGVDSTAFGAWLSMRDRRMLVGGFGSIADPDDGSTITSLYELAVDCDGNNVMDDCDIASGAADLDHDGHLDICGEPDCNGNGVPDDAEPDCDLDTIPDACEIDPADPDGDGVVAADCNGNGIPDECEMRGSDCNGNGVLDECEMANCPPEDTACRDCDNNGRLDECDVVFCDCDGNGIPDECDALGADCNLNGVPDACELGGEPMGQRIVPPAGVNRFPYDYDMDGEFLVVSDYYDGNISVLLEERVFVYQYNGVDWEFHSELIAGGVALGDGFGASVSIDGNIIVVGAPKQDSVSYDGTVLPEKGAAYVFRFDGEAWVEDARLPGEHHPYSGHFGEQVRAEAGLVIAGCSQCGNGSMFVFQYVDHQLEPAPIHNIDGTSSSWLTGAVVDCDDDWLVVNSADYRVKIYRRIDGALFEQQELFVSSAGPVFGDALAIRGDLLAVGAAYHNQQSFVLGKVFLYRFDGAGWTLVDTLPHAPSFQEHVDFGASVVITPQDRLLVGTPRGTTPGSPSLRGSIFQFDVSGDDAVHEKYIAFPTGAYSRFGSHIEASSAQLVADYYSVQGVQPDTLRVYALNEDCNSDGRPDDCHATGDMNADGAVDTNDIDGFVGAILSGASCSLADLNDDGATDSHDVHRFVEALLD
ncbi:MAG TPA: FG-GAP repeat protein [Phycisphaerae bacterium]|nr:FG-GAP repeat protein [Phycisphaerae bacterium]